VIRVSCFVNAFRLMITSAQNVQVRSNRTNYMRDCRFFASGRELGRNHADDEWPEDGFFVAITPELPA
jgi:hypothetical protein